MKTKLPGKLLRKQKRRQEKQLKKLPMPKTNATRKTLSTMQTMRLLQLRSQITITITITITTITTTITTLLLKQARSRQAMRALLRQPSTAALSVTHCRSKGCLTFTAAHHLPALTAPAWFNTCLQLSASSSQELLELKKRYVRRFLKANCSQAIWSSGVRDMLVSISAAETLCMHRQRGITSKLRQ